MVFIFITVVVLVVGLIINIERKRIETEKLRLKKIAELAEVDNNKKNELKAIFNEIDDYYKSLSDFKDKPKYISNYDLYQFKELHKLLLEKFNEPEYELLPDFDKEITTINQFKSNFNSLENDIQKRNAEYVAKELENSDAILSNIEGKSLDAQQRKAVVIDEDNNLIIAGAGSGKTTTIAGKVKYLTEKLGEIKVKFY